MPTDPTDREAGRPAEEEASEAVHLGNPRPFITAGKAVFTLQGSETRYTYRVNRAEPKAGSPYTQVAYFVSLLTGPDNTADYTYLGMLDPQTGAVRLTRKSQYTDQSKPVLAIRWVLARLWANQPIDPAKIYHIGRCGRCGRALTVPASIEAGIGPECAGKL